MEDWQGCLSPACQAALKSACARVTRRGGYAVTLEDFLLSTLDEIPDLCRFLRRQGVDLDELTRTIQCEQPIVTAVASENLLSSQLIYWFHCAREASGAVWLGWPLLLQTLVHNAERLREKAYVAQLEMITCWPCDNADDGGSGQGEILAPEPALPVVTADTRWLSLVEEVSVLLSASPRALIWVCGARGSGKSSWLRTLIPALPGGAIEIDIRREMSVLASGQTNLSVNPSASAIAPVLVLDNLAPADLAAMLASGFRTAWELVVGYPGPILLLGPDSSAARSAIVTLEQLLGRNLDRFAMPVSSVSQKLAILTAHQPMIEKRWQIELAPGSVEFVTASRNPLVASPGAMLQWVERAAARLNLFAARGPLQAAVLDGRAEAAFRQSLLALARQQPAERFEQTAETLTRKRDAAATVWFDRKRNGTLRQLTIDDLRSELARRVAADRRSGDYSKDPKQTGEQDFARS